MRNITASSYIVPIVKFFRERAQLFRTGTRGQEYLGNASWQGIKKVCQAWMCISYSMALPLFGTAKRQAAILRSITELLSSKLLRRFSIPFLVVVDASRNDEARDAVIGLDTQWNLLYVVHIEREGNTIRIISARKATRQERAIYEN